MRTDTLFLKDFLVIANSYTGKDALAGIPPLDALKIEGERVFLRLDLNVPIDPKGAVTDITRIQAALPTIHYLLRRDAALVVASHLGRPKGKRSDKLSLKPVAAKLTELLKTTVHFVDDCVGAAVEQRIAGLRPGEFLLLENTRFHKEEEANDAEFARQLATGTTVYINDAFGTLHRAHASTAGMTAFYRQRSVGLLVRSELAALQPLLTAPRRPFTLILGGAKVADKIEIMRNLLPRLDRLLIGGGMAYTFLKAKGVAVGDSLLDAGSLPKVLEILGAAEQAGVKVVLPVDFRIARGAEAVVVERLQSGEAGLDIGPRTVENFIAAMDGSGTLFWNGPLGVFERPPFMAGTMEIAKAVAALPAHTVIGGGDTMAAFAATGLLQRLSHVSTGGGATLEFLEGRELPGLQALERSSLESIGR